ncbi:MAG: phosphonate C-P lyase system protein PhnH [Acidiphilium sp.]|nr:phosphonate C-P lyase system protein PhnH [Acidiphilium sp.]MDD4936471.1 phosphonate C-P lyase system protein PhnH [Acidiphilium sp.]
MMDVRLPGFANNLESQRCFRAILQAMSHPGLIITLDINLTPPAPLSVATAAALLTLVDATVRVAMPENTGAGVDWLVFHTGARIAAAAEADFIVASAPPSLANLYPGTDEEPEAGATLILELPGFGCGPLFRLTGPGIESNIMLQAPLDAAFIADWRMNDALAPRGIDLLLCAGASIVGLPRSVTIEEV